MLTKITTLVTLLVIATIGISVVGVTTDGVGGCTLLSARPCYDKNKNGAISVLGKNAANTFKSCFSNSSPNERGVATMKTSVCGEEQFTYSYCFEGKSHVYIREFKGFCSLPPPPPPPPPPTIACSDGIDNDSDGLIDYPKDIGCTSASDTDEYNQAVLPTTFKVLAPNGGESLAFGSSFPIRWEGGDPAWPIELSIISGDGRVVRRGLAWGLVNDGTENWIVDLPIGSYVMYARGCSDQACATTAWDYGNSAFSVVPGAPLARIISDNITNQPIVVLSPSGGESWQAGSSHEIIWSGALDSSMINVSLIDYTGNRVHSSVASSVQNSGKYAWEIPTTVQPGLYTINISCTNCTAQYGTYGYSFEPFTVTAAQ